MRQEIYNEKYGMAYGLDHVVGKFIQIWKLNSKYGNKAFENQPDSENIIVDRDEFQGRLSVEEVVKIAGEYGFNLEHELPEQVINYDENN